MAAVSLTGCNTGPESAYFKTWESQCRAKGLTGPEFGRCFGDKRKAYLRQNNLDKDPPSVAVNTTGLTPEQKCRLLRNNNPQQFQRCMAASVSTPMSERRMSSTPVVDRRNDPNFWFDMARRINEVNQQTYRPMPAPQMPITTRCIRHPGTNIVDCTTM